MDAVPPTAAPKGAAMSFQLGWNLFRMIVWCTIVIWAQPQLLDWIGGHQAVVWLGHHRWVWWLGVPPLALLALISVLEPLDTPQQRAKAEALAGKLGAAVVQPEGLDLTRGIRQGPGMRMPVGRWTLDVDTSKQKGRTETVARVRIERASTFSFVARSSSREPAVLRGLQQGAMAFAMRDLAQRTDDPRAAAAAQALAYLSEAPLRTGDAALDDAVVLRSNQPDTARALLTSPAVTSALMALNGATRHWDWTHYPAEPPGAAEMAIAFRGKADEESLRAVRSLLQAALDHLTDRGALAA